MAKSGLWYFAHPYTVKKSDGSYSLAGEDANFRICCIRSAWLIENGWNIYSPIAHTHPIHMSNPSFVGGEVHEMWYHLDEAFIRQANFTGIILAPGWEQSTGCIHEKELFEARGLPVHYLTEVRTVWNIGPKEVSP